MQFIWKCMMHWFLYVVYYYYFDIQLIKTELLQWNSHYYTINISNFKYLPLVFYYSLSLINTFVSFGSSLWLVIVRLIMCCYSYLFVVRLNCPLHIENGIQPKHMILIVLIVTYFHLKKSWEVNHVSSHAMHREATPHQNQGIQFREIKIQNSTFEGKKSLTFGFNTSLLQRVERAPIMSISMTSSQMLLPTSNKPNVIHYFTTQSWIQK